LTLGDSLKAKSADYVIVLLGGKEGARPLVSFVGGKALNKVKAGDLVKELAHLLNGSGGGKAEMASGQVKTSQGFLDAVKSLEGETRVKKVLGLDFGTRSCGIAESDTFGIAHPKEEFRFLEGAYRQCLAHLAEIIKRDEIHEIALAIRSIWMAARRKRQAERALQRRAPPNGSDSGSHVGR
jgi:hypothetical protein